MAITPTPDPETLETLLNTTWRMVDAESAQTTSLDGKAASLIGFAGLVLSLTAVLAGKPLNAFEEPWAFALYVLSLVMLSTSAFLAIRVILPKEHLTFGMGYLARFPTWSEIRKPPEQVRGEVMIGLVEAIAGERRINRGKARNVRLGFVFLFAGLVLVAFEATTLGLLELIR